MRTFVLSNFKLFIVHFLSMVIVKLISRIGICSSTWPSLGTSDVKGDGPGYGRVKPSFAISTRIAVLLFFSTHKTGIDLQPSRNVPLGYEHINL